LRLSSLITLIILIGASDLLSGQPSPENGLKQEKWGQCKSEDSAQAIAACSELIGSGDMAEGTVGEAFEKRGLAYFRKGDYDRAIEDFDQALRLKPKYGGAFLARANAYVEKKDYDLAIRDYDQVLRLDPDSARAFYDRGIANTYKGTYDRAIQDYDHALHLKPGNADSLYGRGLAFMRNSPW
jgi:tetratricopeptide (TPR) repeat protein